MPIGYVTRVIDATVKALILRAWSRQPIPCGPHINVRLPQKSFSINIEEQQVSFSEPVWVDVQFESFRAAVPLHHLQWARVPINAGGVTLSWPPARSCVLTVHTRIIEIQPAVTVRGKVGPLDITTTVSEIRRTSLPESEQAIDVDLNSSPIDVRLL